MRSSRPAVIMGNPTRAAWWRVGTSLPHSDPPSLSPAAAFTKLTSRLRPPNKISISSMQKVPRAFSAVAILSLVAGASYWMGGIKSSLFTASPIEVASSREQLPDKFRGRLDALVVCATKVSASAEVGMSISDFGIQLQDLEVTLDFASTIWSVDPDKAEDGLPPLLGLLGSFSSSCWPLGRGGYQRIQP